MDALFAFARVRREQHRQDMMGELQHDISGLLSQADSADFGCCMGRVH